MPRSAALTVLAVLLAAPLLAGCAVPSAYRPAPCARLVVPEWTEERVVGTPMEVRVVVVNCGKGVLRLPGCSDTSPVVGFRLMRGDTQVPLYGAVCPEDREGYGTPVRTKELLGGGQAVAVIRWDGTARACGFWCEEPLPVEPGAYTVTLSLREPAVERELPLRLRAA